MLPGVKIKDLIKIPDERGFFSEIFRDDWSEFTESDKSLQANVAYSYPGMIRAWHRHHRGQVDYFTVVKGSIKICAYDARPDSPTKGHLDEIILSGERIQCVRIPGLYYHGYKAVGNEPALLVYLTTKLYDYKNPDEERIPWNSDLIIDPSIKKPYDWNKSPYK